MEKYLKKLDLYWAIKHYKSQLRCKILIMKLDIEYKILERRKLSKDDDRKSLSEVDILLANIFSKWI
jgi:hypothetical protein